MVESEFPYFWFQTIREYAINGTFEAIINRGLISLRCFISFICPTFLCAINHLNVLHPFITLDLLNAWHPLPRKSFLAAEILVKILAIYPRTVAKMKKPITNYIINIPYTLMCSKSFKCTTSFKYYTSSKGSTSLTLEIFSNCRNIGENNSNISQDSSKSDEANH